MLDSWSVAQTNIISSFSETAQCHTDSPNNGSTPAALLLLCLAPFFLTHTVFFLVFSDISALPGETVTLPCSAPKNSAIVDVGWGRPDLQPQCVFLSVNGRSDPAEQHPSYVSRVELKDAEMEDGDVSLILKNVTINDTGTYVSRVTLNEKDPRKTAVHICVINLTVRYPGESHGGGRGVELNAGLTVCIVLLWFGITLCQ
ncbi:hypothetical protein Q5P01_015236 [Channa striata]|uniref:Ig-like domain-containing protein n=1 Tax=Channa striata TaxID=64152 RepID=A0AA88MHA9_CHASR|nr:hypothetical protein Q5P01_015236 [Channa striata]